MRTAATGSISSAAPRSSYESSAQTAEYHAARLWTSTASLRWLTAAGQRDLARLRFVVGGAGGTGAQAALALAYLGARQFVLIDPDCADRTSLHRMPTARAGDAGKSEVEFGRRGN